MLKYDILIRMMDMILLTERSDIARKQAVLGNSTCLDYCYDSASEAISEMEEQEISTEHAGEEAPEKVYGKSNYGAGDDVQCRKKYNRCGIVPHF
jgi:hypothetical protein